MSQAPLTPLLVCALWIHPAISRLRVDFLSWLKMFDKSSFSWRLRYILGFRLQLELERTFRLRSTDVGWDDNCKASCWMSLGRRATSRGSSYWPNQSSLHTLLITSFLLQSPRQADDNDEKKLSCSHRPAVV